MTIKSRNAVCEIADRYDGDVSNLMVQKILYLGQVFNLGMHGVPLIRSHFEAWAYGPVCPMVYHHLKHNGAKPIGSTISRVAEYKSERAPQSLDTLVAVIDRIQSMDYQPSDLVSITHRKGGAWEKNYTSPRGGIVISHADMRQEYGDFYTSNGSGDGE